MVIPRVDTELTIFGPSLFIAGVTANSVHPGTVKTQIYRLTPKSLMKYIVFSFAWPMFKVRNEGLIHVLVYHFLANFSVFLNGLGAL
jgi:hypothetical protein